VLDRATTLDVLRDGEIEVIGRIVGSSNNAMLVTVTRICPEPEPVQVLRAVYKPILGERPLNDFPDGTLARREVAAWHVSEATGWGIVPPTVLRDGPFGEGMVQAYVEPDPAVDVVHVTSPNHLHVPWSIRAAEFRMSQKASSSSSPANPVFLSIFL